MLKIMLKNQTCVYVSEGEFVIPKQNDLVSVYACTDGISCWLEDVSTVEELDELISPENIIDAIKSNASEDELLVLEAVLFARDYKYLSYDNKTILTAIY